MNKEQIKQRAEEWMRNNSERCTKENMNGYDFAIATCIAVTTEVTKELQDEVSELKKMQSNYCGHCNRNRLNTELQKKLTKAKEIIRDLLACLEDFDESTISYYQQCIDEAKPFLKENEGE